MKNNENEQSESPTKPRQILSAVRQFMYPEEFRIGPPVWPPDLRGLIEKLAGATSQATAAADSQPAGQEAANEELMRFVVGLLAEVGTGIWRMKQKMVKPGTSEPLEETRRAYRHLESTWDVLTQAGVQIIDHTNEVVPEGGVYGLKAIAYQPTPGIGREVVIETIKPTVYFNEQMIQMGEVIIGTPEQQAS